jgi:two-component system chemotaxis response regulator CheY
MLGRLSRILVVDGDAVSRNTTHKSLHTLGYTMVDYAPDGRTALRLIGQSNYRLVLADWDMGPIDGQELLKQTRSDRRLRHLPFLMAIDRWQKKFIEIVRDDGATLYLTKPFTTEVLGERMIQVADDADRLIKASRAPMATAPTGPAPNAAASKLWQYLRTDP